MTDEPEIVNHSGVRMPVTEDMVLDWYALTDPAIRKHNPSLESYAEELLRKRELVSRLVREQHA